MIDRGGVPAVPFRRVLWLLVVPPIVCLVAGLVALLPAGPAEPAAELDRTQVRLQETFQSILHRNGQLAQRALEEDPEEVLEAARRSPGGLRVEGVARLDSNREFLEWDGTPAEPPDGFEYPDWPGWTIRVDGVRTRLLARASSSDGTRLGLVSFVIDSTLDDLRFDRLLPDDLSRRITWPVEFRDTAAHYGERLLEPPDVPQDEGVTDPQHERLTWLRAPSGESLALVRLATIDRQRRRAGAVRLGLAWGAVSLVLMLALLFDWRSLTCTAPGILAAVGAVALARTVLIVGEVPLRLLSRTLGSASVYGSGGALRGLASPADLLLTAVAIYLLCVALRRFLARWSQSKPLLAGLVGLACAGLVSSAGVFLALSLARNSRLPLSDRPAPFVLDVRLGLWLGLVLVLLGAAELWAQLYSHRRHGPSGGAPRRLPIAAAFVILAVGTSFLMLDRTQRLTLEQLTHEIAPQVLEQNARRRVALVAAVRGIQARYDGTFPPDVPLSSRSDYLAYHNWVHGDLFHEGYKSSLSFYSTDGTPISHFGFDLPALDETPGFDYPEGRLEKIEVFDSQPGVPKNLLHVEVPVVRDGQVLGFIIGHVLDEPENQPFLPWSRPYLAAMGPGGPAGGDEQLIGRLEYVLYDGEGAVQLTTLVRPPAVGDEAESPPAEGQVVRVLAGDQPMIGLALAGQAGQRHLLLLPRPGMLERLAMAVRVSLLGLTLVALLGLVGIAGRKGGIGQLVRGLRGSFYRRLLATLLLASIVPLIFLAFLLETYIERQGEAALANRASRMVSSAQRIIGDYSAVTDVEGNRPVILDDNILYWLRNVVGQEFHVYSDGLLQATTKRELFASGLLPPRLEGEVAHNLIREGVPYEVVPTAVGQSVVPVAYAAVHLGGRTDQELIVAVPLAGQQREIARAIGRVTEMIVLATVAIVALLAVAAAFLARTVARPVRALVGATARIAGGDYGARLQPQTQDEIAELVHGFNAMASALSRQRADLEHQRDYRETLLRHATTGVISVDGAGRIVTLNPASGQLLEAAEAELKVGAELVPALESSPELAPLARAMATARTDGEPMEVDLERDDEPRRLRLARVELRNSTGEGFGGLILLDDVTDLMRSNQLAAWAEMARVIAHEIKNPLTPIQLSSDHLGMLLSRAEIPPTPEMKACLDTIVKQVRALYDIAGEFSTYAKLPALTPEATDPQEFMQATLAPYRTAMPGGIELVEEYRPAPSISIDSRVLRRALVNFVENALQAMVDGGKLVVGVEHDAERREVLLTVSDTGPGLSADVRSRLFEPYFSTKSSGTGLGLAIAQRAIEAHDGRIEVVSAPTVGTRFTIHLPA